MSSIRSKAEISDWKWLNHTIVGDSLSLKYIIGLNNNQYQYVQANKSLNYWVQTCHLWSCFIFMYWAHSCLFLSLRITILSIELKSCWFLSLIITILLPVFIIIYTNKQTDIKTLSFVEKQINRHQI